MAFDSMRDFLARHVMKRVNVYRIDDFNMDPPELHKLKQRVDTYSIKPDIKLNVTKPFDFDKKMTCKATRLDFAALENVKSKKYKEKADICNAIGAHHDEEEATSLYAPIVQVCDAISGARPGARREIVEAYIKRLNDLEAIAMSYPGVTKTYAIQAGRELRVIVGADKMSDAEVLDCIRENKSQYAATEADRLDLIHDLCAIIEVDEKVSVMEEQMVRGK